MDKKEIVRRVLLELPALSSQKVARLADCDPKVVNQIRREMVSSGEIPSKATTEI